MPIIYIPPSASQMVTEIVLPKIKDGAIAVAVIGLAVFLLLIVIRSFRWVRKPLKNNTKNKPGSRKSMGVQTDLSSKKAERDAFGSAFGRNKKIF